ncbi:cilia- and flagella-associated protein 298-like [Diadema antillarum]|uniref:cilia- and flagella-associated protein 298-like n=1 Tax=Diadema antillarum TaxID=105358 RepID=UPI003A8B4071
MVKLHIKKGEESQFMYETTVQMPVEDVMKELLEIYNGRLKVERICSEIGELAEHGTSLPPNMQGLTDDQIQDLKLVDEWGQKCEPSGGAIDCKDPIGRRNGKAPNEKMKEVLTKTVSEAKKIISKNQVSANVCVTAPMVKDALDQLRGAVTIVYPMGLPPHDPIRMEFEGQEELEGTQASLSVLEESNASLWFSGKEMHQGKKLCDYLGKNEKTKIIAKLQKKGQGAPGREAVFSEDERKQMMLHAYRKQEEWKKMEEDSEDVYLNSAWADSGQLKKQLQGMNNVKWGPR